MYVLGITDFPFVVDSLFTLLFSLYLPYHRTSSTLSSRYIPGSLSSLLHRALLIAPGLTRSALSCVSFDFGHPTGDSPCSIIPSGTDVSLVAFESFVRTLAELAHVSDKTRAFLPLIGPLLDRSAFTHKQALALSSCGGQYMARALLTSDGGRTS